MKSFFKNFGNKIKMCFVKMKDCFMKLFSTRVFMKIKEYSIKGFLKTKEYFIKLKNFVKGNKKVQYAICGAGIIAIAIVTITVVRNMHFDSDVMATFDGGQITRVEFREWHTSRGLIERGVNSSIHSQKNRLHEVFFERIAEIEAQAQNFDTHEGYKLYESHMKMSILADYLRRRIRSTAQYNVPAIDIGVILFRNVEYRDRKDPNSDTASIRVRMSDAEIKTIMDEKFQKAEEAIAKLKAGADFDEVAKEFSEEVRTRTSFSDGFIIRGMKFRGMEDQTLFDAAMNLQKGEFTTELVKAPNGYFIVYVYDRMYLTEKNIDKAFKLPDGKLDRRKIERIKNIIESDILTNEMERLRNEEDVVNNIEGANFNNPDYLLFSVGDEKFHVRNLDELQEFIDRARPVVANERIQIPDETRILFAERLFYEKYMSREALRLDVESEKEFQGRWGSYRSTALYTAYLYEKVMGNLEITEEMLRNEYDTHFVPSRERRGETNIPSFASVRDELIRNVSIREREEKRRDWEDAMMTKYNFRIIESSLVQPKPAKIKPPAQPVRR